MSRSPLADAFAHHVWATTRLIDACQELSPDQLSSTIPGTYGSIIDTLRHLVAADAGYLSLLSGGQVREIDEDQESRLELRQMREAMSAHGPVWSALLEDGVDPDADMIRHRDDGTDSHAPVGIRLAQALHHGTDHRSQVCTALTTLGIEPPQIDVWDFGHESGRVFVSPA
ncbi:MAG TPA: DinB family protein [Candidatus Limnocylindrales bacterium]|nr:DinB family protein [Candidatus Limnocylindrales bacterium]